MKKFSSILFATALILMLAAPGTSLAVRLVPGTVPQTKSLQPIPNGVEPNVSENISKTQDANASPDDSSGQTQDGEDPTGANPEGTAADTVPASGSSGGAAQYWGLRIFAFLLVVGGAVLFYWKKIVKNLPKFFK
jgi:hypothetical protein